jgi:choline-glycine betaine transporter
VSLYLLAGNIFSLFSLRGILLKRDSIRCTSVTPVGTFTLIALWFASGLDVDLIVSPLTGFVSYADIGTSPEYTFTNPLAIEFGFWAFLISVFLLSHLFLFLRACTQSTVFPFPWLR